MTFLFQFKEKEAPFLKSSCPQRPLHSYGISSHHPQVCLCFHFLPFFPKYQFVFICFLWVLCSLMIHYLWELRLFYPQVCLYFPLSLSQFLMPISALVSLINHGFVEIVLLLDISYYTHDFFVIHV